MNAEQMFEELGYEKKEESEGVLLYISDFENSILFEKKRVTITDLYCYGRITININHLLENAIHEQCKELGWLEDEKQEIKKETNIEHYCEYLSKVGLGGFAVVNGRCTKCSDTLCSECDFSSSDCCNKRLRWLASPYRKKYKLTKFENDLLQSYLKGCLSKRTFKSVLTLNVMKEKGYFKGVDENATIKDILADCEVIKDVNG